MEMSIVMVPAPRNGVAAVLAREIVALNGTKRKGIDDVIDREVVQNRQRHHRHRILVRRRVRETASGITSHISVIRRRGGMIDDTKKKNRVRMFRSTFPLTHCFWGVAGSSRKRESKVQSSKQTWGAYGILQECDMWNKRPEFQLWLMEIKNVTLELLPAWVCVSPSVVSLSSMTQFALFLQGRKSVVS